ncbi:MAG: hypothetical protein AAGI30_10020 [Planctomycetota bacterium]
MPRPVLITLIVGSLAGACLLARVGMPAGLDGTSIFLSLALVPLATALAWVGAWLGYGSVFHSMLGGLSGSVRAGVFVAGSIGLGVVVTNAVASVWLPGEAWQAWAVVAPGLGLGGWRLVRWRRRTRDDVERASPERMVGWVAVFAVVGIATLVLGASWSPGSQWRSEALGYDTLSYHLMLPREWLMIGRVTPLEHNVYSHLPSGMEAIYAHAAVLLGASRDAPLGLGSNAAVLVAGFVHAMIAIVAAGVTGLLAAEVAHRAGADGPVRALACSVASAASLLVPWTIVTGSSAYNEQVVNLALAGGVLAVIAWPSGRPIALGVVVGLICGAAVLAKPTAMFMAAAPVGLVILATRPRSEWVRVLGAAAAVGLVCLVPWLVRNAAATGNPVFPYAAGVFGTGHWSAEQVARWNAGHHFDGGPIARIAHLFGERGLGHPQWSGAFVVAPIVLGAGALVLQRVRVGVVLLAVAGVQVLAWLGLTHLQSRFLVPMVVPMSVVMAAVIAMGARGRAGVVISVGVLALMASWVVHLVFVTHRAGPVNAGLVAPPAVRSGAALLAESRTQSPREFADLVRVVPTAGGVNLVRERAELRGATILLIGSATPLFFEGTFVYSTTWDESVFVSALRAADGDLSPAIESLRLAGITHALVDQSELDRLRRSGWLDPVITPEVEDALLRDHAQPVFIWPERGIWLVELLER